MINAIPNNRTGAAGDNNDETGLLGEDANARTATQAVEGIASALPPETLAGLRVLMQHSPQNTPILIKASPGFFANQEYSLGKLHNAFSLSNPELLPSAKELQNELNSLCNINNFSSSKFLIESIEEFFNQFLGPSIALENIPINQLNKLATNSAVLVNALVQSSGHAMYFSHLDQLSRQTLANLGQLYTRTVRLIGNSKPDVTHAKFLTEVCLNPFALQHLDNDCKNNTDIVCVAVQQNFQTLQFASDRLRDNPEIVLVAVEQDRRALHFASDRLKDDAEFMLAAVQQDFRALRFASDRLKDNAEFMLAAVQQNFWALQFASNRLKDNYDFVLALVNVRGEALEFASDRLRDNFNIVLAAIQNDDFAIEFASDRLKDTDEIVRAAVLIDGIRLEDASERLKNDPDMVLFALKRQTEFSESAFEAAGDQLKMDPYFVLRAIEIDPAALKFASDDLQLGADHQFMLAAVQRNGLALEYASDNCRRNPIIVAAAIQQNPEALQFALEEPQPRPKRARPWA